MLKMCEVEAEKSIRLQFKKPWRDDAVLEVYGVAADVACARKDEAAVIGDDQLIADQLSVDA